MLPLCLLECQITHQPSKMTQHKTLYDHSFFLIFFLPTLMLNIFYLFYSRSHLETENYMQTMKGPLPTEACFLLQWLSCCQGHTLLNTDLCWLLIVNNTLGL